MKEYSKQDIKNGNNYAYDYYIVGTTISDIIKELTYDMNRYGVGY